MDSLCIFITVFLKRFYKTLKWFFLQHSQKIPSCINPYLDSQGCKCRTHLNVWTNQLRNNFKNWDLDNLFFFCVIMWLPWCLSFGADQQIHFSISVTSSFFFFKFSSSLSLSLTSSEAHAVWTPTAVCMTRLIRKDTVQSFRPWY